MSPQGKDVRLKDDWYIMLSLASSISVSGYLWIHNGWTGRQLVLDTETHGIGPNSGGCLVL